MNLRSRRVTTIIASALTVLLLIPPAASASAGPAERGKKAPAPTWLATTNEREPLYESEHWCVYIGGGYDWCHGWAWPTGTVATGWLVHVSLSTYPDSDLSGQVVTVSAQFGDLCTLRTDAEGYASCWVTNEQRLQLSPDGRYWAVFHGTARLAPSSSGSGALAWS